MKLVTCRSGRNKSLITPPPAPVIAANKGPHNQSGSHFEMTATFVPITVNAARPKASKTSSAR